MGVYNNNKDGTRSTLAKTIQVVDAPMEQFLSRGEFNAVTPNNVSADNKLIDFDGFNTTLKELELIEDIEQYKDDPEAVFVEGAVGDGVADDSQAFLDAISEGYTLSTSPKIIIPRGKYNLNHVAFDSSVITNSITFIGESAHLCELIDANISALYGITCKNITFNGGTQRELTTNNLPLNLKKQSIVSYYDRSDDTVKTSDRPNPTMIIVCTPYDNNRNLLYENCVFKNADVASLAFTNTNSASIGFTSQVIKNCKFQNLKYMGIFHRLPIVKAECINNIFSNIGVDNELPYITFKADKPHTSENINGQSMVGAVTFGDTSNSTNNRVVDCIIKNNIFDTLKYWNDYDRFGEGVANFIAINAQSTIITNNSLKDLISYNIDRESIYVKSDYSEIAYNYIENGGLGEGYICCKQPEKPSPSFDRTQNIHDNIIIGEYGRAIRLFVRGEIFNNYINIKNIANQVIDCTSGSNKTVEIFNNYLYCGIAQPEMNGHTLVNYRGTNNSDKVYGIKTTQHSIVNINQNIVIMRVTDDNYNFTNFTPIYTQSVSNTVKCNCNQIFANRNIKGIAFHNGASLDTTMYKAIYIEVNNNFIYLRSTNKSQPIYIQIYNRATEKNVVIKNNQVESNFTIDNVTYDKIIDNVATVYFIDTSQSANFYDGFENNTLEFETHQRNISFDSTNNYVKTDAVYVITENMDWISPR